MSLVQPESLSFTRDNNRVDQFTYNAVGHVVTDLSNSYKYDAEGRACAVSTLTGVMLYLYNASGTRVAKGTGSFSCEMVTNGATLKNRYVLDLTGRQMTEYDGSGNWLHTNVFANGGLLATYSSSGTPMTFALNDWPGTKRGQAKADGALDMSFPSLPYGDQLARAKAGGRSSGQESDYLTNQSGQTVTKATMGSNGAMQWDYTNVYADGELFATYDAQGLHFQLNDWLGTRRVTTNYAGVVDQACASLPYGDQLTCSGSTDAPNEQHFTGKERDAESGNDYFGARYYASNMGRFMSPDWSSVPQPVPFANLSNPQTLNLYSYVGNNPLSVTDPFGHNWFTDFLNGVANATYRPIVFAAQHPIVTGRALGNAAAHPIATARANWRSYYKSAGDDGKSYSDGHGCRHGRDGPHPRSWRGWRGS